MNVTAKILYEGQGTRMVKNNALLFSGQNKMCNLFPCLAFSWDNLIDFSIYITLLHPHMILTHPSLRNENTVVCFLIAKGRRARALHVQRKD